MTIMLYIYIYIYIYIPGPHGELVPRHAARQPVLPRLAGPASGICNMYVCIYVYIYTHIYTHTYIHEHIYIYIYIYRERERSHVYICIYIYIYVRTCFGSSSTTAWTSTGCCSIRSTRGSTWKVIHDT